MGAQKMGRESFLTAVPTAFCERKPAHSIFRVRNEIHRSR